jgi:hypothetical protein
MRLTLLAAIAASSILASTVDAQTKYYARERFVGMPKTAAAPPAKTCSVPQQTYWHNGGTSNNLGYTGSAVLAQKACNDFLVNKPTLSNVICMWNPANGSASGSTYVRSDSSVLKNTGPYASELYASSCQ